MISIFEKLRKKHRPKFILVVSVSDRGRMIDTRQIYFDDFKKLSAKYCSIAKRAVKYLPAYTVTQTVVRL